MNLSNGRRTLTGGPETRGFALLPAAILILALAPSGASAGDLAGRGPVVTIPPCIIEGSGCGLDPSTPELNPAACAADLAGLLRRRGIDALVAPPAAGGTCAADPQAVVLTATVAASCPASKGVLTPKVHVVRSVLRADLSLRDCSTAREVGRGSAERRLMAGRRRLLRDAVDSLGDHLDEAQIGLSHPGTPRRWMRGDAGGWRAFEVSGGITDISDSDLNRHLESSGLEQEKRAPRFLIEWAYYPWTESHFRVSLGLDVRRVEWAGEGRIDFPKIHIDPGKYPRFDPNSPRYDPNSLLYDPLDTINAEMGSLGLRWGLAWGTDVTRHQQISLQGAIGYYTLGTGPLTARIKVEGLPSDTLKLRAAVWGMSGAVRWEWRIAPHIGVSLSAGYDMLNFGEPDCVGRKRFFPVEVAFSGPTAALGVIGRF